jgi:hypothetical protein
MISSGGELGRLYSIEDYLGEDSLEFGWVELTFF